MLPIYAEIQYAFVGTVSRLTWVPRQAVGSAAGGVRRCDYWHSHPQPVSTRQSTRRTH